MQSSSDYILDTSREYSIYVCESRAIPKASDGLKDGQRKALWLMRSRAGSIKTVSLAGEMISSGLYLHGDKSASDTISLLAAPYCNNVPLLEGEGNFGTRVAPVEGIGAPRYTYVKKNRASDHLIFQDLDIVPLKDNYDGSTKEPVTFLPIIPTILLNGISGIAVGWSTEILPRTLNDIITATIGALEGRRFKKLKPKYDYLDLDVIDNKDGSWEFIGKVDIVNTSEVRITELPPDLTLDKFKKRLLQYEEAGRINDWTDRSTDAIDITVKFKRGSIKGWTEETAINFFKLKAKKTERIVVVDWDNKAIRQYESAEKLVEDFVEWRFNHYVLRYQKLLADTSYELKYWMGVKACFDANLPSQLLAKKDKAAVKAAIKKVTSGIGLDDAQLEKITNLPTYRWAKDFLQYCKERIKELKGLEKEYQKLLRKPSLIRDIYKDEVLALKREKFDAGR